MARRQKSIGPQLAHLTFEDMRLGVKKFNRLLSKLEAFDPGSVNERFSPEVTALEADIKNTFDAVFGPDSSQRQNYSWAHNLDRAAVTVGYDTPMKEVIEGLEEGKSKAIALTQQARQSLIEDLEDGGEPLGDLGAGSPQTAVTSRGVVELDVVPIGGRLEIADPPPDSAIKLNRGPRDLPTDLAALTSQLGELVEVVRGENEALGEMLKAQLIATLQIAIEELRKPYTEPERLKKSANWFKKVGDTAATQGASKAVAEGLKEAGQALLDLIGNVF